MQLRPAASRRFVPEANVWHALREHDVEADGADERRFARHVGPVTSTPCGGPRTIEFGTASSMRGCRSPAKLAREPAGVNEGRFQRGVPARTDAMLTAASTSPTAAATRSRASPWARARGELKN